MSCHAKTTPFAVCLRLAARHVDRKMCGHKTVCHYAMAMDHRVSLMVAIHLHLYLCKCCSWSGPNQDSNLKFKPFRRLV